MDYQVKIKNRDFSSRPDMDGLKFTVNRYSFRAVGGPEIASVSASGNDQALWDLLGNLRCPLEIYDERGNCTWWGMIRKVTVRVGALAFEVGLTLDSMSNRVAVKYSYIAPGTQEVGTVKTTAWAEDATSIAEYGYKELLEVLGGATSATAEAMRDALLARLKLPIMDPPALSGALNSQSALIECVGWWKTLNWRRAANPGVSSVATTDQVSNLISLYGQFLTGTLSEALSGVLSESEYQDGNRLAGEVIEELLKKGVSGGRRLLAWVDPNRMVRIYEEPASSSLEYLLKQDGTLETVNGGPVEHWTCPVARWCGLKDVIPPSVDFSLMSSPAPFFIEWSQYDPQATPPWAFLPRDVPGAWE